MNDTDADWPKCNQGRKSEGRNHIEWMSWLAHHVREAPGIPEGEKDRRVSAMLVALVKSEEGPSCRGPARHFDQRPGDPKRCELDRPYGKSWCLLRMSHIDPAVLREMML